MKRILFAAGLAAFLGNIALAAPVGPIKPAKGKWALEFEASGDEREMRRSNHRFDRRDAENVNLLGRVSYGVSDRVEASVRLGASDLDIDDIADANATRSQFDGSHRLAWGAGLSGMVVRRETWGLGLFGNYLAHYGHDDNWPNVANANNDFDYSEWQAGIHFQGKYDPFQPYIGVKYSDATIEYNRFNGVPIADDESVENVGVYIGAGFDLAEQWSGYFEGRHLDEVSFGGGIRYTF